MIFVTNRVRVLGSRLHNPTIFFFGGGGGGGFIKLWKFGPALILWSNLLIICRLQNIVPEISTPTIRRTLYNVQNIWGVEWWSQTSWWFQIKQPSSWRVRINIFWRNTLLKWIYCTSDYDILLNVSGHLLLINGCVISVVCSVWGWHLQWWKENRENQNFAIWSWTTRENRIWLISNPVCTFTCQEMQRCGLVF